MARGGLVAASVAGVDRPSDFHERGPAFTFCRGLVFIPLWNDGHLTFPDEHITVPEVNVHISVQHDENLVGIFVVMLNELPLKLHDLEAILVHLGDDFRGPVLREL